VAVLTVNETVPSSQVNTDASVGAGVYVGIYTNVHSVGTILQFEVKSKTELAVP
jgi:hypothetical protein